MTRSIFPLEVWAQGKRGRCSVARDEIKAQTNNARWAIWSGIASFVSFLMMRAVARILGWAEPVGATLALPFVFVFLFGTLITVSVGFRVLFTRGTRTAQSMRLLIGILIIANLGGWGWILYFG